MSTTESPRRASALPPLVAGQRLDRATFHERYEAMPPETRAELIGGVVQMPSPLSFDHCFQSRIGSFWLGHYQRFTPGVTGGDNASVFLGEHSEVQPDALLLILPELGGATRFEGGYLAGPPELVIEISRSSRSIDLGIKRDEYERAGVAEYLVVALEPDEVHWFARRDRRLVERPPDGDGLHRSEVFPGLWLDPLALFARDLNALIVALDRGLATPEHAAFVDRLREAGPGG